MTRPLLQRINLNLLALAVVLAAVALAFCGCASTAKGQPTTLLIQPLLDRIVPADFTGDGDFGERGAYLVIEVKAGGLKKMPTGWTWAWLSYRRTISIPLAPGVPYTQTGWITLGTPTPKP